MNSSETLTTLDEKGHRVFVYPVEVHGYYRRLRTIIQSILILFFILLPWIKINGYQALLLDIPQRRFFIFGLMFWAHDVPMVFFVFGSFIIGIFLVTAIWGRLWCGWACPQTVFIDGVYRRIERWVEGTAPKRKALARAPWSFEKVWKFSLKWTLFTVATLFITHSFLALFVGREQLMQMTQKSPVENPLSFLFILGTTALSLFNFTWFREQFCIIMCPYGRLQSALMDEHSMVVNYDKSRSDCIDCKMCINVCPTRIDIRNGTQMECIACTACIDVCDSIMKKVNQPPRLIRYSSDNEVNGIPRKNIRPRSLIYMCVLCILLSGLAYFLVTRESLKMTLLRTEEIPTQNSDPTRIFHFSIEVNNQSFRPIDLKFSLRGENEPMTAELVLQNNPYHVTEGKTSKVELFVKMPRENMLPLFLIVESPEKNALFDVYKPAL